jgi:hypothetical protein
MGRIATLSIMIKVKALRLKHDCFVSFSGFARNAPLMLEKEEISAIWF